MKVKREILERILGIMKHHTEGQVDCPKCGQTILFLEGDITRELVVEGIYKLQAILDATKPDKTTEPPLAHTRESYYRHLSHCVDVLTRPRNAEAQPEKSPVQPEEPNTLCWRNACLTYERNPDAWKLYRSISIEAHRLSRGANG